MPDHYQAGKFAERSAPPYVPLTLRKGNMRKIRLKFGENLPEAYVSDPPVSPGVQKAKLTVIKLTSSQLVCPFSARQPSFISIPSRLPEFFHGLHRSQAPLYLGSERAPPSLRLHGVARYLMIIVYGTMSKKRQREEGGREEGREREREAIKVWNTAN